MNSDESDWDSMSEAPPVQAQAGQVTYPPPGHPPTEQAKPQTTNRRAQPTATAAPTPKPRPPSSQPPTEVQTDFKQQAIAMEKENTKSQVKPKKKPQKKAKADDEHFSDLAQKPSYEDSGLGSSPEREAGLDNPGYQGEESGEEERRGERHPSQLPVPDERISLLPFDDLRTRYFQVVSPELSTVT